MSLGAPDRPEAVRPFLTNLFSDPAIIALPTPLRWSLARLIAQRRAKTALDIYSYLGGGSPLRENTEAQARALEAALGDGCHCFVAMRYWHPLTEETATAVKAWEPDEIVCMPLYPQFSTTTSGSSLAAWQCAASGMGLICPAHTIESYPTAPGFIAALAGLIAPMLDRAREAHDKVRLLLSAHGLPLKIVRAGDPYPEQIAQTAAALIETLAQPGLDWAMCYQSRVGPLKWLGPLADDEIRRAGEEGTAVVIAPISFVSEHSETLVELDRDYRRIAERCGVPGYYRVPAVGTDPQFIAALAELVRNAR